MSGCASIDYYAQSIQGQFELLNKQEPIEIILKDENLPTKLRKKLNIVLELRDFSIKQLKLPDNNSYLSYADLERNFVIWNIFATEEFSLTPLKWCYLIVGCLDYRGYFNESDAHKHSLKLKEAGYDTYLGGVSAYSTLGWFDDPVLNTMLRWSNIQLAKVMFHELAHQQLYIKNDTEFNEAYAETIAYIGVKKWLKHNADEQQYVEYEQSQEHEKKFILLIMKYKALLAELYNSDKSTNLKRQHKQSLFNAMSDEYKALSQHWARNVYANWFSSELNNAKLAAIVTYRKHVPALLYIYEQLGSDLMKFYAFSTALSNCDAIKRNEILEKRKIKFEC